jgi:acyl transferase domain-containing protein
MKDLGREYWVSNMVGQVKFAHSVRKLCLETSDVKTRTRKTRRRIGAANKVNVDMLIEIGHHLAVGGPVKQILQADERLKTSRIVYASALTRKSSAVVTLLQLASTLFTSGYPIDFATLNRPQSSKQQVQCLNDLPPYAWNHSKTYWAEPRISKVYRNRKFPRTDLLGVPDRHASEDEPRWRNHIRVEEIPWVRDHKVQSQIVYPAAGYIIMAIEAIKQRVSIQTNRHIATYTLRDVSIKSATMLNEGTATEVMVSLWPHDYMNSETMSQWHEFRVASVSNSNKWTQHCDGLVAVKYAPSSQEDPQWQRQQAFEAQRLQELFREATRGCTTIMEVTEFYPHLKSLGLEYGETFANMSSAHSTNGRCLAKVTIPDTAAHMPMNFEYPFVIHPSTMDSVLHPILVALSTGSKLTSPTIPISIDRIEIGSSLQNEAGTVLDVLVSALQKDSKNIEADITAVHDIANPNVNLSIFGLVCRVLDDGDSSVFEAERASVVYKLDWAPDARWSAINP